MKKRFFTGCLLASLVAIAGCSTTTAITPVNTPSPITSADPSLQTSCNIQDGSADITVTNDSNTMVQIGYVNVNFSSASGMPLMTANFATAVNYLPPGKTMTLIGDYSTSDESFSGYPPDTTGCQVESYGYE